MFTKWIKIYNITVNKVKELKRLGVTIDYTLTCDNKGFNEMQIYVCEDITTLSQINYVELYVIYTSFIRPIIA